MRVHGSVFRCQLTESDEPIWIFSRFLSLFSMVIKWSQEKLNYASNSDHLIWKVTELMQLNSNMGWNGVMESKQGILGSVQS